MNHSSCVLNILTILQWHWSTACLSTGNHNWVGSNFAKNAGAGLVLRMTGGTQNGMTVLDQVKAAFERDWRSRSTKSLQGHREQQGKFGHLHQDRIHIGDKEEKERNEPLYLWTPHAFENLCADWLWGLTQNLKTTLPVAPPTEVTVTTFYPFTRCRLLTLLCCMTLKSNISIQIIYMYTGTSNILIMKSPWSPWSWSWHSQQSHM